MRYSLISRISLAAPRQNRMAGRGAVSAVGPQNCQELRFVTPSR